MLDGADPVILPGKILGEGGVLGLAMSTFHHE
jgi:hypothetical protein